MEEQRNESPKNQAGTQSGSTFFPPRALLKDKGGKWRLVIDYRAKSLKAEDEPPRNDAEPPLKRQRK